MKAIDGINLTGYKFFDDKGLNVCGLAEISGFNYNQVKPPYDKFLKKLAQEAGYNPPGEGNFLFAFAQNQIADYNRSFLNFLLEYPSTRIIHHYNNNAHLPHNLVFICMLHMYPDKVKRPDFTNNVKEYLKSTGVKWIST